VQNETPDNAPVEETPLVAEGHQGEPAGLSNRWLYGIIVSSFIFALGSIPMYRIVCKKIDPGGSSAQNGDPEIYDDKTDTSRDVRIRFTTSVERQLPFEFTISHDYLTVHPGQRGEAIFKVTNLDGDRDYRAKAVYDINPPEAGQYLKKIQCFCFDEQTIAAGSTVELPLLFWFDSKMPPEIKEITIAYTYFNMESSLERSKRDSNEHAVK
jgi:cytochrome c oxidase assembly protein subunit 11